MAKLKGNTPLISVVLPTYNRAIMLRRAVQSIVNQTYKNWELVIIDNCSTDDTDSVVASFNDCRIKLLKIRNNGSIGKSRNLGIKSASGEWIAFIDSDDWWVPNKLTECIAECSNEIDLIYHDLLISINGKVKKWKRAKGWNLSRPVINDLMVRGNAIANSSVIVRKSLLKKIGYLSEDMNINPSVDYNTWLKIATITDAFKYIPKALGGYLVHPGGVSQRDMSISYRFAMLEFIDYLSENQLNRVKKSTDFIHGRYLYLNGDYKSAAQALKASLCFYDLKRSFKALILIICIKIKSFPD